MNKIAIVLLVVASVAAYSSAAVRPQSKLYFSIPLGAAVTTAAPVPAPAATTAAASTDTTTAAAAATTAAAATSQAQLNIIPLGQLLGILLTGLFGSTLPSGGTLGAGAQLQIVPLGQALATVFGSLFG